MTAALRRRGTSALAVLVLGAAGCGSSPSHANHAKASPSPKASATPGARGGKPASKADDALIRAWADALRAGHVEEAARFFAIPSIVSNGTPPVPLRSRSDIEFFNAALPCGAKVSKTVDTGVFVVATFVLTERPGAGTCGSGVGGKAATAFMISKGKILQWRRVVEGEPEPDPAPGDSV
jgi:hypothetical protein